MDIPANVWNDFDSFVQGHSDDFYRLLTIGLPDDGTQHDDCCPLYTCIINKGRAKPVVSVGCRGKHTYYDWQTRQHGEVFNTPTI